MASLDSDKNETLSQFDEQALVKQCKWIAMGAESLMIGLKLVEAKLKESIYEIYEVYRGVWLIHTMEIAEKSHELAEPCKAKFLTKS